ncbi:MAG: ATP-dependent Clp protease ATP-binding subunit [Rikenellaceae bacterium]
MQKREISKSLDSTIATATFTATKLAATRSFEDILFLELIADRNSLCHHFLSSKLERWQIDQLELRIQRLVNISYTPTELSMAGVTPEIFYRDMINALAVRYPNAARISSLHALHFISSDTSTSTSRLLTMFGITPSSLERDIAQYTIGNSLEALKIERAASNETKNDEQKAEKQQSQPQQMPNKKTAIEHPLAKFGTDLTELARNGEIDPVIGREEQTQRVIEILSRRKKNNPILVGEAGVGKSAIAEGLALRIAANDVPHTIKEKKLFSIDITSLVAGTKFRGEFEERMQQLLKALRESKDTIVFIDEIHTIVGAGSTQGSLDTANILKPALARGEIQLIGATTFDEYRTNIESDAALVRRLQRVVVEPTSVEQSIAILERISPKYEQHHNVKYSADALRACVTLSERYITERNLPDKAIDLLDEAGARANIAQNNNTAMVEQSDIEEIITSLMGIPPQTLSQSDISRLSDLERELKARIIGQDDAVKKIARTIKRSRTGISDAARPTGVFLFVGPSGVGKTLLAKELSKWMFHNDRSLIRIDMSEYGEKHNTSRLIGSPPGYVGYGEGGELSEAVRRNPYSVVLLDEIEKAHPDTFNLMLQIFDEGRLTDGTGRHIDFRNTVIIITSNAGSRKIAQRSAKVGYSINEQCEAQSNIEEKANGYKKALEALFAPEFLNRIDETIIFNTLSKSDISRIVKLELDQLFGRVRTLGYNIKATDSAYAHIADLSYDEKYGARELRRTLTKQVEEPLAELIIDGMIEQGASITIEVARGTKTETNNIKLRVA